MARRKKSKGNSLISDLSEKLKNKIISEEKSAQLRKITLTLLAIMILFGIAGLSLHQLEQYVRTLPIFTSTQVTVSLESQPPWMSKALAAEILTKSFAPIRSKLAYLHHTGQDEKLPEILAKQLKKNPWVKRVIWVRRTFAGSLVINCTFREPLAQVKSGNWYYLVDFQGYLLPGRYSSSALAGCGLMEIKGVAGTVPKTGKLWKNEDLQSGLKLVKLIRTMPFRKQIKAIDVTNYNGRIDPASCWIVLITARDTIIRWGRPPGQENGLEISADQKLALLTGIYKRHGYVDFGRSFVDIRRSATEVDVSIASADIVSQ